MLFEPEDSSSPQTFKFEGSYQGKLLKFNFSSMTDFYGRVVVYQLSVR